MLFETFEGLRCDGRWSAPVPVICLQDQSEMLAAYCAPSGRPFISDIGCYIAFALFRYGSICQGGRCEGAATQRR
jgi:hypothetical protein